MSKIEDEIKTIHAQAMFGTDYTNLATYREVEMLQDKVRALDAELRAAKDVLRQIQRLALDSIGQAGWHCIEIERRAREATESEKKEAEMVKGADCGCTNFFGGDHVCDYHKGEKKEVENETV